MSEHIDTSLQCESDCSPKSKKIQQLEEWLSRNQFNDTQFKECIDSLNLSPADFQPYYHFSPDSYTRNRILQSTDYELILICWEVGQTSPVHNHGFSQCFMYCVEGSVIDNGYRFKDDKLSFKSTNTLHAGDSAFIHNPDDYHQFGNANNLARAVTLHLYSPKITTHHILDKTKYDPASTGMLN